MRTDRATRSALLRDVLSSAFLLCTLAACGRRESASAASQSTATGSADTATAATTPVAQTLPDPCSLLTKEEAQVVLGEEVRPPDQHSLGGTATCDYNSVKLHGGVAPYTVHIALSRESQDAWDAGKKMHAKEMRPATGVGDDAYFLLDDLVIRSKGYDVDVGVLKAADVPNHRKVVDDAELAVARKVTPRLT
jgi:hypothetical protein